MAATQRRNTCPSVEPGLLSRTYSASLTTNNAVSGTVSGLPVFCCTISAVRLRQSMSRRRRPTMSQARRPVVSASRVMAASRALTAPAAQACTTRRSSSSLRTGRIDGNAHTRKAHRFDEVDSTGELQERAKFDTTQNSGDLAHLLDSDSRKPKTLAPSASSKWQIPCDSKNTRYPLETRP